MLKVTRDSRCPLCGSIMTDFHYSHSDGESARRGLFSNICANNECGLPVKLWARIMQLKETIVTLEAANTILRGEYDDAMARLTSGEGMSPEEFIAQYCDRQLYADDSVGGTDG